MKVTPDFIKHFGSGADPNDVECMAGYLWYVATFGDAPQTGQQVIDEITRQISTGDLAGRTKELALALVERVKASPEGIRMSGDFEMLPLWQFEGITYDTLASAHEARDAAALVPTLAPFEVVNVLRKIAMGRGSTTTPVKSWDQITPGARIMVFDPATGLHNEPDDPRAEILRLVEREAAAIRERPIFQKIKDTLEGYEAWEKIT